MGGLRPAWSAGPCVGPKSEFRRLCFLRRGALHLPTRRSRQNANLFLREPSGTGEPIDLGHLIRGKCEIHGAGTFTGVFHLAGAGNGHDRFLVKVHQPV